MNQTMGQPENMRLPAPAVIAATRCAGCTQCRLICPVQAITKDGYRCHVLTDACTCCGRCVWICPVGCISAGDDIVSA